MIASNDLFESACRIHLQFMIERYLMSNAEGRWDGAEKATRHREMCGFYVAVTQGIEVHDAHRLHPDICKAVHKATQVLTDNLDEKIGFPLKGRPDYDDLFPKFFSEFHRIAMDAVAELA